MPAGVGSRPGTASRSALAACLRRWQRCPASAARCATPPAAADHARTRAGRPSGPGRGFGPIRYWPLTCPPGGPGRARCRRPGACSRRPTRWRCAMQARSANRSTACGPARPARRGHKLRGSKGKEMFGNCRFRNVRFDFRCRCGDGWSRRGEAVIASVALPRPNGGDDRGFGPPQLADADARFPSPVCPVRGHEDGWSEPHLMVRTCPACGAGRDREAGAASSSGAKGPGIGPGHAGIGIARSGDARAVAIQQGPSQAGSPRREAA